MPPKALIVYQPGVTESTGRMAHQIAKGLKDGGYEVTLNYPGDYLSTDISKYAILFFGSPVYSGQPSKVLTDYMSKIRTASSCKVILFSTGGFKYDMELQAMEKTLNGMKVLRKLKFITGKNNVNDQAAYDRGQELAK